MSRILRLFTERKTHFQQLQNMAPRGHLNFHFTPPIDFFGRFSFILNFQGNFLADSTPLKIEQNLSIFDENRLVDTLLVSDVIPIRSSIVSADSVTIEE